jgi:hypothetical protein
VCAVPAVPEPRTKRRNAGRQIADFAVFGAFMLGGSFLPGIAIGVFVVAVLAIVHLAQ